ncbi:MAG: redoxin domain-containing protein [Pseudomonadota bacterium]
MIRTTIASLAVLALAATPAAADAPVGAKAPAFTGLASDGTTVSLADYAGETVILEWTNHGCPYVKKVYNGGVMQDLQAAAAEQDVVWLTIISSAPGKQGHVRADEANELSETRGANPAKVILDPKGKIGRAYGAVTTPHMFVIDPEGVVQYAGAIDDRPTSDPASLEGATNYVRLAMNHMAAGEPVEVAQTQPYGCSVKY